MKSEPLPLLQVLAPWLREEGVVPGQFGLTVVQVGDNDPLSSVTPGEAAGEPPPSPQGRWQTRFHVRAVRAVRLTGQVRPQSSRGSPSRVAAQRGRGGEPGSARASSSPGPVRVAARWPRGCAGVR